MDLLWAISPQTWGLLTVTVGLLYWYGTRTHGVFRNQGIPGPQPLPFLGTMMGFARGVWKYDIECHEKYGKMWGMFDGVIPSLVIADRDLIRSVMVKDFHTAFVNRRDFGPPGPLRNGLTFARDDEWKRIRALLSPTFTSARLKEMFPIVAHYVDILVQHLRAEATKGRNVRVKEVLGAFSMDIMASTAFGMDVDSLNHPCDPFVEKARKLLKFDFLDLVFLSMAIFPFLTSVYDLLNVSMFPRDSVEFFRKFVEKTREQRRDPGQEHRVDFLQLMVNAHEHTAQPHRALTDTEILAQSVVFIFAGYETTSSTLAFMLHALATRPDVQTRLQREIDAALPGQAPPTYEALPTLTYLDAVVCETLRLFPICSRVDRVCGRDVMLGGLSLPRGAVVTVPVFALHRDPRRWAHPDDFRPERFTGEERATIDPYDFLPFGCGPRNCISRRFALMNMKLALTRLLQHFSFRTCEETQVPLRLGPRAALEPEKPIVLRVESRDAE